LEFIMDDLNATSDDCRPVSGAAGGEAEATSRGKSSSSKQSPSHSLPDFSGTADLSATAALITSGGQIGQYRIIRKIGEGGMGTVFEAEQQHPRRHVALKIISAGVVTSRTLRRFEHESQILGRLHHVGIAQIFEAGTFDVGAGTQPFFAMEYIKGLSLPDYVQKHQLGTRRRVELLIKICQAVEHAHQKGVIHRDLKPGNILVDETGEPKILDFGVARVTDADVQTATLQTDIGQLVGTIPYMSPEQVSGDPQELDTRSDVYALGVVCYELLTGHMPYDLHHQLIHEAVRVIREVDPKPLSSLNKTLRGDVETIISKALSKEKDRRYQSANDFATDLRHYLADEPINARPASALYQLRKFTRRNRALVFGTAAVFAVSVVGAIVSTMLYLRAEEARASEAHQKQIAQTQAQIAQSVNAFLVDDLLPAADPSRTRGRLITVRQVLDASASAIEGRFADKPEIEAAIRLTLGNTYRALGDLLRARPHLERALALRSQSLGEDDADTHHAANALAGLYWSAGLYDLAEPMWQKTLQFREASLGKNHADTLAILINLGLLYRDRGELPQARALLSDAETRLLLIRSGDDPTVLVVKSHLAWIDSAQGHLAEAESGFRSVLINRAKVLGADHPDTLQTKVHLAWVYQRQGRSSDAEQLMKRALEELQRVVGVDHPDTLVAMTSLGLIYRDMQKFAESEKLLQQAVAGKRRVLGDEHPDTLLAMSALAGLHMSRGDYDHAEPLLVSGLEARVKLLGEPHPSTINAHVSLASLRRARGDYEAAERLLTAANSAAANTPSLGILDRLVLLNNLASLNWTRGQFAKAQPLWEQTLSLSRAKLGKDHPHTILAAANVALLYRDLGEYVKAHQILDETLQLVELRKPLDEAAQAQLLSIRAHLLLAQKRYESAMQAAQVALKIETRIFTETHARTWTSTNLLALSLRGAGKLDEAEPMMLRVLEWRRKNLGNQHPDTLYSLHGMALIHRDRGRLEQAYDLVLSVYQTAVLVLGAEHPNTLMYQYDLARILQMTRKPAQAEKIARTLFEQRSKVLGPRHPDTERSRALLVELYESLGRGDEAAQFRSTSAKGI